MKKRLLSGATALALLACCLLTGCKTELEKFSAYSYDCFDTVTTITGYAKSQEDFDRVSNEILARLGEYHRLYDIYKRYDGLNNLCTINDLTDGVHTTVKVDSRIIDLLAFSKEMHQKTDGLVNVAMGSVLRLWHDYRTIGTKDPASASLPPMERLKEAADHTNIEDMVIDEANSTVTLTDPQMRLDVGAIAKGYAVEQVARWMEEEGYTGYVLNVGGNVRAVGAKADGSPWLAGIENPEDTSTDYLTTLELTQHALVTSGSYQRYYVVDGEKYHHIIHPDTLMPATGLLSVSVVCPDSGTGDALSTALFCLSVEEGKTLVESLEDVEALWVAEDGTQTFSSGWEQYVKQ